MAVGASLSCRAGIDQDQRPELRDLAQAAASSRSFDARFVGFPYAPFTPTRAGKVADPSPRLRIEAARLEQLAQTRSGPRERAAAAIARLIGGDADTAIRLLEDITTEFPGTALWWVDLSAAYLGRSPSGRHADDVLKALEAAEIALELAPNFKAALFNRAIAIESLPLPAAALSTWEAYLRADPESGWANEARQRHQQMAAEIRNRDHRQARERLVAAVQHGDAMAIRNAVPISLQTSRELLEEELLPKWASAYMAEESSIGHFAERIATIGRSIADTTGDQYGADVGGDVNRCSMRRTERCQMFATGIVSYDRARRLYDDDRFIEADPQFKEAFEVLRRARVSFAARAQFQWSVTQFYLQRRDVTAASLEAVLARCVQSGYFALQGRALWMRGLLRPMPDEFGMRIADYRAALAAFERARERPNVSAVHTLIAETSQLYGDYQDAWNHRHVALSGLLEVPDPRRRHAAVLDATRAARAQGYPRVASIFAAALLDAATRWQRPVAIAEAYVERARADADLGRRDLSLESTKTATLWWQRIPDEAMRRRLAPFLLSAIADASQSASPGEALKIAEEAAGLFRMAGQRHHLLSIARIRAQAKLRLGKPDDAKTELSDAIDELDSQRRLLDQEAVRISHTADAWSLYRDMIALTIDRDPDAAFLYAERGRGLDILDAWSEPPKFAATATELERGMPHGVLLLAYVVLDKEVLAWALHSGGHTVRRLNVSRQHLDRLASTFQAALQYAERKASADALSRELFDALLAPFAPLVGASRTLVIVPDEAVANIPFAALVNPTGRFVAATHQIVMSPSVRIFAELTTKMRAWSEPPRSAAVVSDYGVSESRGLTMPNVDAEIEAVRRAFPQTTVVDAFAEPKEHVLASLGNVEILHFTGHGVVDLDMPERSHMLIASRPGGRDVRLFATDLERVSYPHTRVVILAACRTAIGKTLRGSTALSLARPFLKRAVPSAIASLWDVDDRATSRLLSMFHEELRSDGDASGALQRAQLRMLTQPDPELRRPSAWAGFVTIGGAR